MMEKKKFTTKSRCLKIAVAAALGLAGLSSISGCGVASIGAYALGIDSDVKPKYVPAKEPLLVMVENTGSDDAGDDASHVQLALAKSLDDNKVAPLVDPQKLELLKDAHPTDFHKMPIDAVGRAVGAKQVLYVNLTQSKIEDPNGGATINGEMIAKVLIVDTQTGETRWPVDEHDGELVKVEIPLKQASSDADVLKMRRDLGDKLADQISKLFHTYPENEEKLDSDN
jgi:hypothetical protein